MELTFPSCSWHGRVEENSLSVWRQKKKKKYSHISAANPFILMLFECNLSLFKPPAETTMCLRAVALHFMSTIKLSLHMD